MSNTRIAFINSGNILSRLLSGMLAKGLEVTQVRAVDPVADTRNSVSSEQGIENFAYKYVAIQAVDVIVLSVNPESMKMVCENLWPSLQRHQLAVSIVTGITCTSINNWLGSQPIVRFMPP